MGNKDFSFRWGIPILDDGYTEVRNFMIRNYIKAGVKRHEMLLIVHLASYKYESQTGESHPSLATIAKEMGYTVQRVCQILNDLEERGLLKRQRRLNENTGEYDTTMYSFEGFSLRTFATFLGVDVEELSNEFDRGSQASFRSLLKRVLDKEEVKNKKKEKDTAPTPIRETDEATEPDIDQENRESDADFEAAFGEKPKRHERESKTVEERMDELVPATHKAVVGKDVSPAEAVTERIIKRYYGDVPERKRKQIMKAIHEVIEGWGGCTAEEALAAFEAMEHDEDNAWLFRGAFRPWQDAFRDGYGQYISKVKAGELKSQKATLVMSEWD